MKDPPDFDRNDNNVDCGVGDDDIDDVVGGADNYVDIDNILLLKMIMTTMTMSLVTMMTIATPVAMMTKTYFIKRLISLAVRWIQL